MRVIWTVQTILFSIITGTTLRVTKAWTFCAFSLKQQISKSTRTSKDLHHLFTKQVCPYRQRQCLKFRFYQNPEEIVMSRTFVVDQKTNKLAFVPIPSVLLQIGPYIEKPVFHAFSTLVNVVKLNAFWLVVSPNLVLQFCCFLVLNKCTDENLCLSLLALSYLLSSSSSDKGYNIFQSRNPAVTTMLLFFRQSCLVDKKVLQRFYRQRNLDRLGCHGLLFWERFLESVLKRTQ